MKRSSGVFFLICGLILCQALVVGQSQQVCDNMDRLYNFLFEYVGSENHTLAFKIRSAQIATCTLYFPERSWKYLKEIEDKTLETLLVELLGLEEEMKEEVAEAWRKLDPASKKVVLKCIERIFAHLILGTSANPPIFLKDYLFESPEELDREVRKLERLLSTPTPIIDPEEDILYMILGVAWAHFDVKRMKLFLDRFYQLSTQKEDEMVMANEILYAISVMFSLDSTIYLEQLQKLCGPQGYDSIEKLRYFALVSRSYMGIPPIKYGGSSPDRYFPALRLKKLEEVGTLKEIFTLARKFARSGELGLALYSVLPLYNSGMRNEAQTILSEVIAHSAQLENKLEYGIIIENCILISLRINPHLASQLLLKHASEPFITEILRSILMTSMKLDDVAVLATLEAVEKSLDISDEYEKICALNLLSLLKSGKSLPLGESIKDMPDEWLWRLILDSAMINEGISMVKRLPKDKVVSLIEKEL